MTVSRIDSSFIAPSPIKWRQQLPFEAAAYKGATTSSGKKDAGQKPLGTNPFAVTSYNLNCPRRTFDSIDLLC